MERFTRHGLTPIPGYRLSDYLDKPEDRAERPANLPKPPEPKKDQPAPAPAPIERVVTVPVGPDPRRTGPAPNRRTRPQ